MHIAAEPNRRRFQFGLRRLFTGVFFVSLICFVLSKIPLATPIQGLLGLVCGHDTVYSAQYTELGWLRVRVGMTEADVLQQLGEPLGKGTHGDVWSFASNRERTQNHHVRRIEFDNGQVVRKIAEFRID